MLIMKYSHLHFKRMVRVVLIIMNFILEFLLSWSASTQDGFIFGLESCGLRKVFLFAELPGLGPDHRRRQTDRLGHRDWPHQAGVRAVRSLVVCVYLPGVDASEREGCSQEEVNLNKSFVGLALAWSGSSEKVLTLKS